MRFRSVLIEDEELSRKRLKRLLESFQDDIEVVGEAENGVDGLALIETITPDLVFLDINLPGLDGFQMLRNLQKQPAVIFTTASDQHALKAFDTLAIDYLLKPIDVEALGRSVEKLRKLGFQRQSVTGSASILDILLKTLGVQYLRRLSCKVGDKIFIVKASEIQYMQSDNKYTSIHTSGKCYLVDESLVDLERKLDPKDFVRIHRSTLINLAWIAEIRKGFDSKMKVVMLDKQNTELSVSRSYADNLKSI